MKYNGFSVGVDSQSGLARNALVTLANVHDKQHPLPQLLHRREKRAYGDSAYVSQKTLKHGKVPQAKDFMNQRVRKREDEAVDEVKRAKNWNKFPIQIDHVDLNSKISDLFSHSLILQGNKVYKKTQPTWPDPRFFRERLALSA